MDQYRLQRRINSRNINKDTIIRSMEHCGNDVYNISEDIKFDDYYGTSTTPIYSPTPNATNTSTTSNATNNTPYKPMPRLTNPKPSTAPKLPKQSHQFAATIPPNSNIPIDISMHIFYLFFALFYSLFFGLDLYI